MIGVAVHARERVIAAEFFELFKTPWEFYQNGGQYDVVLCTSDNFSREASRLVLILDGEATPFETEQKIQVKSREGGFVVSNDGKRLPIYGRLATFPRHPNFLLKDEGTQEPAAFVSRGEAATILRVGYNLFEEVRFLLGVGQPAGNAGIATLDEHIAWLRDWIIGSGSLVVEIPPIPTGHCFIACLTHDVDHPMLRNHWCDHTMFGFLYRSTVGTLLNVCRGRKPVRSLWRNLRAASLLPFVHLGTAKDFWAEFDRYTELEAGLGSTFFVIPRRGYPSRTANGSCSRIRACRYDIEQLLPQLRKIASAGGEVGVHGLDAWLDVDAGREEREKVSKTTGTSGLGVRMHWLHFDENSPAILDRAGFDYDTTVGYGETVGYRAGTLQVYRPLGVNNLLELPLHVMDTALFYPVCLNLREEDAERLVRKLIDAAERFGGVLTINWHDRSIAPERLWDDFYLQLVRELRSRGAWLPTAAQAVAWFRKRRSAAVEYARVREDVIRLRARLETADTLPGLRIRITKPGLPSDAEPMAAGMPAEFVDVPFNSTKEVDIDI
jgi:hypothetical protein